MNRQCNTTIAVALISLFLGSGCSTTLSKLIAEGRIDEARSRIRKGEDIHYCDELTGWPPLFHAAKHGHAIIVRDLIEHGADVNARDSLGFTARMKVAPADSFLLLFYDHHLSFPRNDSTTIQDAPIQVYRRDLIPDPDSDSSLGAPDTTLDLSLHNPGQTAIAIAAREGHLEVVKELLANGADVSDGVALYNAGVGQHFEIMELLLDRGVDPNTRFDWAPLGAHTIHAGLTPLVGAVTNNKPESVRWFLKHGAKADVKWVSSDWGWGMELPYVVVHSPLGWAFWNQNSEVYRLLRDWQPMQFEK